MAPHERRLAEGVTQARRAIFRSDAGNLPMREFELREKPDGTGGTKLHFNGYASVTEQGYTINDWIGDYTEIVRQGAFKTTLSQDPDVAFLLNHTGMTMARTRSGSLRLSEDDTGLHTDADLDPRRSDINDLRIAIENGDIDEMSFAFRVTRQQWSPDYDQRDILEVDINGGDVSTVNKGANPFTGGLVSVRSLMSPRVLHSVNDALRAGAALSEAQSRTLQRVLSALAVSDGQVDASVDEISSLLGETAEEASTDAPDDEALQEALDAMAADLKAADQA
jgi:hypothetical protein